MYLFPLQGDSIYLYAVSQASSSPFSSHKCTLYINTTIQHRTTCATSEPARETIHWIHCSSKERTQYQDDQVCGSDSYTLWWARITCMGINSFSYVIRPCYGADGCRVAVDKNELRRVVFWVVTLCS
jgi:hypothetical protein